MKSFVSYLLVTTSVLWICGCALEEQDGAPEAEGSPETYAVEGTVTYEDGDPLRGARVSFSSLDGNAQADALTNDQGHYHIGGDEGEGLPAGDYRVVVHPPLDESGVPLKRIIDPKYSKKETSGLTKTIKPVDNHYDIEVTRAE